MHQVTHRSFPNLLEHYRHRGQDFLVWEAVKLSIGQVLRSRYSIDEGALAAIVWPVGIGRTGGLPPLSKGKGRYH